MIINKQLYCEYKDINRAKVLSLPFLSPAVKSTVQKRVRITDFMS